MYPTIPIFKQIKSIIRNFRKNRSPTTEVHVTVTIDQLAVHWPYFLAKHRRQIIFASSK